MEKKPTQQELAAEVIRLSKRVRDLEDEVTLLRAQNDYLLELASAPIYDDEVDNVHTRDTTPAYLVPTPSTDRPTRPSSPKAIHLDELHAALEASATAKRESGCD